MYTTAAFNAGLAAQTGVINCASFEFMFTCRFEHVRSKIYFVIDLSGFRFPKAKIHFVYAFKDLQRKAAVYRSEHQTDCENLQMLLRFDKSALSGHHIKI